MEYRRKSKNGAAEMDSLKTTNESLAVQPNTDSLSLQKDKILSISQWTAGIDYRSFLGQVVQYANIADVLTKIKAGTQYVVQIPLEHQFAFQTGEHFLMQNQKTGKLWPTLMKVTEHGRNEVVTPLPIQEQSVIRGNPFQNLANCFQNILMQQQMAQLTHMVEETYRVVERIESGQMDDRIGLLLAGKNGISLALSMPAGEERNMQIAASRQNLLTAQAQIGKTLERRAAEFQPLSQYPAVRFWRELSHSGYLRGKDREVSEIQEYYDLYLNATKLIAASYVICSDIPTAEKTFKLGEQFLSALDFSKVKTIEFSHKSIADMFYLKPVEFLTEERIVCLDEAKGYDYIALEVSGDSLLEVLGDGKSETLSEENSQ
ncbi:MAG: hypothetical protein PHE09_01165 [Oscillospiraceae bacterium]|nr:hypothetical protein [Oscillospiraceae bacterium]